MNSLIIPSSTFIAVATMPEAALCKLSDSPLAVKPLTSSMRRAGEVTLARHEQVRAGEFNVSNFASPYDRALAVEEHLPPPMALEAERRFAEHAVRHSAPEEAILYLVDGLARSMKSAGMTPGMIEALLETLVEHTDQATVYPIVLTGFSVPELQVAMREVHTTLAWFPSTSELIEAALRARRFFREVRFAASRQLDLIREAGQHLAERDANAVPDPIDGDVGF